SRGSPCLRASPATPVAVNKSPTGIAASSPSQSSDSSDSSGSSGSSGSSSSSSPLLNPVLLLDSSLPLYHGAATAAQASGAAATITSSSHGGSRRHSLCRRRSLTPPRRPSAALLLFPLASARSLCDKRLLLLLALLGTLLVDFLGGFAGHRRCRGPMESSQQQQQQHDRLGFSSKEPGAGSSCTAVLSGLSQYDIVIITEGSTAARVVSLAGVRGTAMAAGLSVKALWVRDGDSHVGSSFSSLFALQYDQRFFVDDVATACVANVLEQAQQLTLLYREHPHLSFLPIPLPLLPSLPPHHQDTPLDSCPGCPANLSLLIPRSCTNCRTLPFSHSLSSCAARRIAYAALRRPDRDFTVAATVPSAAQAAAGMFHESRAPLVLQATRKRGELGCGGGAWWGGWAGGSIWGEGGGGSGIWGGIGRGKGGKKWGRRSGWWSGVLGGGKWGSGGMESLWWWKWVFGGPGRRELCAQLEVRAVSEAVVGWDGCDAGRVRSEIYQKALLAPPAAVEPAVCPLSTTSHLSSPLPTPPHPTPPHRIQPPQIVEFLALAHAPSLFFALHDSPEAHLLTALAAAARGPLGLPPAAVEPAVCPSPVLPPLASLRFAQQMIMDAHRILLPPLPHSRLTSPLPAFPRFPHPPSPLTEKLGVMYCQIQKVASTSWKMWMRSERGFKHISSYFHTHHAPINGLTLMGREMGEDDVMFHVTRGDLVKVVFVRHPLPRLLSAHGDKLANGGESRNVSMWNQVGSWVAAFLERVAALVW
ncbi:unnamed protein product, partial [Closterium sp. NIES-54]